MTPEAVISLRWPGRSARDDLITAGDVAALVLWLLAADATCSKQSGGYEFRARCGTVVAGLEMLELVLAEGAGCAASAGFRRAAVRCRGALGGSVVDRSRPQSGRAPVR